MVKLAAFVTVVFAAMAMADPIPQASGAAVQSGREGYEGTERIIGTRRLLIP